MSKSPAETLKAEAMGQFAQGRYDEALTTFEAAAQAFAQADRWLERAEMLNNMGVIYRVQRQSQAALKLFEEATTIFAQEADTNRQAQALANIGDLHAADKQREAAARCYSDAAELFAQTGDRERQSQVLRALSLLRLRQMHWLEAINHMERSLDARPRLGLGQRLFRWLLRLVMSLMGGGFS